jgi:excisionase family DNA binding protein
MHLNVWIVVFAAHSNVEAPELQRFLKIRGVGHEIRKCNDGYYLSVVSEATPLLQAEITEFFTANPGCALSVVCMESASTKVRISQFVANMFNQVSEQPLGYNMKQAARRLGISYSYIKRLVIEGRIERINGRISSKELERYTNKQR